MIYDGLYQLLSADPGVAAIVAATQQVDASQVFALSAFDGNDEHALAVGDGAIAVGLFQGPPPRIWPLVIPQSDRGQQRVPCIVYQLIDRQRAVRYCGTDELAEAIYQVDAYAKRYNDAKVLAAAVQAVLIDFRGLMGSYFVHQCSITSELDLQDPEPGLYRVNMTFSIWHGTTPQA